MNDRSQKINPEGKELCNFYNFKKYEKILNFLKNFEKYAFFKKIYIYIQTNIFCSLLSKFTTIQWWRRFLNVRVHHNF